jgi:hypothetical protein
LGWRPIQCANFVKNVADLWHNLLPSVILSRPRFGNGEEYTIVIDLLNSN